MVSQKYNVSFLSFCSGAIEADCPGTALQTLGSVGSLKAHYAGAGGTHVASIRSRAPQVFLGEPGSVELQQQSSGDGKLS